MEELKQKNKKWNKNLRWILNNWKKYNKKYCLIYQSHGHTGLNFKLITDFS
jgi:hypothetical protein